MPISSPDIAHGTITAYNKHKCRCDECKATKAAYARRSRERHPDYAKNYYWANPELCRQRTRNWAKRNPDMVKKKSREWNQANRERANASLREWRKHNKDKIAAWNRTVRAQRKTAKRFEVTIKDWRKLVNRFGGRCAYCDTKTTLTTEHVVPLVRGGAHSIGNIIPVCAHCNSSKGKRLLIEWRKYRGDF